MVILLGEFLVTVGIVQLGAIFQLGLNKGILFEVLNLLGISLGFPNVNLPHIDKIIPPVIYRSKKLKRNVLLDFLGFGGADSVIAPLAGIGIFGWDGSIK